MELATVLTGPWSMIMTILVLNILLPTADVVTDLNLAVKLFKHNQPPTCKVYSSFDDGQRLEGIYEECVKDPVTFCSDDENRQYCFFFDYTNMATVLLIPFLLNYIVCFYTFFRQTTRRKKYLFIFPLLNLYPQYGKTHSS